MRLAHAFLILLLLPLNVEAQTFTAAWWNVENLFDTRDDPRTNDDDFTPDGEYRWTYRKLQAKLQGIAKTLVMADLPDVVGLAEVENKYVLRDSTVNVSDSAEGFFTRDILVVEGVTPQGDTLCFVLNHWPSKRGGEEAEAHRMDIAATLRRLMNELYAKYPQGAVVAMGDMNSTADEAPMAGAMGFGDDSVNADGIRNLTLRLPRDWGSHKFQGQWDYIDQVLLLAGDGWQVGDLKLLRYDHLLTDEKNRTGVRPRRTNQGPRYEGGLSDHLPLRLRLRRKE